MWHLVCLWIESLSVIEERDHESLLNEYLLFSAENDQLSDSPELKLCKQFYFCLLCLFKNIAILIA